MYEIFTGDAQWHCIWNYRGVLRISPLAQSYEAKKWQKAAQNGHFGLVKKGGHMTTFFSPLNLGLERKFK
jgi:hypothetical protein